ncbi:unnamed protein product [Amoebophrya sp. A25]|nr:unnamed protein product [Amoebophrya sp. A25]|eukprot:GSA25T00010420001.1
MNKRGMDKTVSTKAKHPKSSSAKVVTGDATAADPANKARAGREENLAEVSSDDSDLEVGNGDQNGAIFSTNLASDPAGGGIVANTTGDASHSLLDDAAAGKGAHFLEKPDLPYFMPDNRLFPGLRTLQNYQRQGISFLFARENPTLGRRLVSLCPERFQTEVPHSASLLQAASSSRRQPAQTSEKQSAKIADHVSDKAVPNTKRIAEAIDDGVIDLLSDSDGPPAQNDDAMQSTTVKEMGDNKIKKAAIESCDAALNAVEEEEEQILNPLWSEYRILRRFTMLSLQHHNVPPSERQALNRPDRIKVGRGAVGGQVATSASAAPHGGEQNNIEDLLAQEVTRLYYQPGTGELRLTFPDAAESSCRGGILADEMGLGKTIQILGLVATDFDPVLQKHVAHAAGGNGNACVGEDHVGESCTGGVADVAGATLTYQGAGPRSSPPEVSEQEIQQDAPTLIVTPLSLMPQWIKEVSRFLSSKARRPLTYFEYYGGDRNRRMLAKSCAASTDAKNTSGAAGGAKAKAKKGKGAARAASSMKTSSLFAVAARGGASANATQTGSTSNAGALCGSKNETAAANATTTTPATQAVASRQHPAHYDLVFTTYGVLNVEDLRSSPLFQTRWRRIILDEAQCIKGKHTKLSKKCAQLKGQFKWAVSGTPMQNSVEELYPLLRFLQVEPYCVQHVWRKLVTDPLGGRGPLGSTMSSGNLAATSGAGGASSSASSLTAANSLMHSAVVQKVLDLIKTICKPLVLRRTKLTQAKFRIEDEDEPDGHPKNQLQHPGIVYRNLITLPQRHELVLRVELEPKERKVYDRLFKASKRRMDVLLQLQTGGTSHGGMGGQVVPAMKGSHFTSILALVLKLRMCLAHSCLAMQRSEWEPTLRARNAEDVDASTAAPLQQVERTGVQHGLVLEDSSSVQQLEDKEKDGVASPAIAACSSCHEIPEGETVTGAQCDHVYCLECFQLMEEEARDTGNVSRCGVCRLPLSSAAIIDEERKNKSTTAAGGKQGGAANGTTKQANATFSAVALMKNVSTGSTQHSNSCSAHQQGQHMGLGGATASSGLGGAAAGAGQSKRPRSAVVSEQQAATAESYQRACEFPSAKMASLAQRISEDFREGRKVLVFSQWTCFLQLLNVYFKAKMNCTGDQIRTLDGSLSIQQRQACVDWLNAEDDQNLGDECAPRPLVEQKEVIMQKRQRKEKDTTTTATGNKHNILEGAPGSKTKATATTRGKCLLISLKAGGVGLNLVAATRAYLLDLWWNPAVEEQAFQRIHRIGQIHEVHCIKFVAQDTVDGRILALQVMNFLY